MVIKWLLRTYDRILWKSVHVYVIHHLDSKCGSFRRSLRRNSTLNIRLTSSVYYCISIYIISRSVGVDSYWQYFFYFVLLYDFSVTPSL